MYDCFQKDEITDFNFIVNWQCTNIVYQFFLLNCKSSERQRPKWGTAGKRRNDSLKQRSKYFNFEISLADILPLLWAYTSNTSALAKSLNNHKNRYINGKEEYWKSCWLIKLLIIDKPTCAPLFSASNIMA